jgi:hypothetical protein
MPVNGTGITDFNVLSTGLILIWAVKDFHRALPLEYITYVCYKSLKRFQHCSIICMSLIASIVNMVV